MESQVPALQQRASLNNGNVHSRQSSQSDQHSLIGRVEALEEAVDVLLQTQVSCVVSRDAVLHLCVLCCIVACCVASVYAALHCARCAASPMYAALQCTSSLHKAGLTVAQPMYVLIFCLHNCSIILAELRDLNSVQRAQHVRHTLDGVIQHHAKASSERKS